MAAPDPVNRPTSIPWPAILLLAAFVVPWLLGRTYPLSWPVIDGFPARLAGIALCAAGLSLMVWAVATLSRHRTTVLPHKGAAWLVTDGPFRFRRNPIYKGEVMVLLGTALLTANAWFAVCAALFALLVTWLAILPEERHLEAKFGQAYLNYKARTRRWI